MQTHDQQFPVTPVFTKKKLKYIYPEIYNQIFIAALFIIVKSWTQSNAYQQEKK